MLVDTSSFRAEILKLPPTTTSTLALPESLRVYPSRGGADSRGVQVYYAPLEAVNVRARVVLIGITPGASQMRRSWRALQEASRSGGSIDAVLSEVKRASAFNDERNQMRPNLYRELEHWRVPQYLGYKFGAELFEEGWGELQTTSLIPYPTFVDGKNYEGKAPDPLSHPMLKSLVLEQFVPLINSLPQALLLPLGNVAQATIQKLQASGHVRNACISGLLHPSGQNTYRLKYLCGDRAGPVPSRTNVLSYDNGRSEFLSKYPSAA